MSTKQIVLVGAGHAHLHIAAHAESLRRDGFQLVLVDPGEFWYSGLATGMLAGQYGAEADQIDPAQLIRRGGGDFLRDRLTGIDARRQTALFASGAALRYDALSLNLGSEVDARGVAGIEDHAWTVKPIRNLWRMREELQRRFQRSPDPLRVIVIGGGPTGCEVAACIDSLARRCGAAVQVKIVSGSDRLLTRLPPGASRRLMKVLAHRGIECIPSWPVRRVEPGVAIGDGSERLPADILVAATGLAAPDVLQRLGLPLDAQDGLLVRATLQSVADDRIFAVGDCARLEGHPLPKLGVFGVRQAPVLLHNLAALLSGRTLKPYRPQKRYLMILNLGCGRALAVYGKRHWFGRTSFWLKDLIDRRFLAKYRG